MRSSVALAVTRPLPPGSVFVRSLFKSGKVSIVRSQKVSKSFQTVLAGAGSREVATFGGGECCCATGIGVSGLGLRNCLAPMRGGLCESMFRRGREGERERASTKECVLGAGCFCCTDPARARASKKRRLGPRPRDGVTTCCRHKLQGEGGVEPKAKSQISQHVSTFALVSHLSLPLSPVSCRCFGRMILHLSSTCLWP